MKSYVIFEPGSGRIICRASAPDEQVPPEGPLADDTGLSVLHGEADPDTQRVRGGKIVSKAKRDLHAFTNDVAWRALRQERHRRLSASDWTQMPDADLSEAQRKAWAAYRQALRELPQITADPASPVWPQEPQ